MLSAWTEILPLLIVKWIARRYCERVTVGEEKHELTFHTARPDVLVKEANK